MGVTCDKLCDRLDKERLKLEGALAQATDPEAKRDLKDKIVGLDADKAKAFEAYDKEYQVLNSERLHETKDSGPVAKKPRRSLGWRWPWKGSKKPEKEPISFSARSVSSPPRSHLAATANLLSPPQGHDRSG